jgi:MoaA/NifB/PqqE/SkfB family radical SAM enzyme
LISRSGFLSFAAFEKVFGLLSETLCNMVISGWGEPLLNPETTKMVKHASENTVPSFLNSNGTIIQDRVDEILDSRLTLINIVLDGAVSKSCHEYNQRYTFTKVVQGVEKLRKKKDKGNYDYPIILGQFIIDEDTVDELEYLENWAFSIGVERVKFKRIHHTMPGEKKREEIFSEHDFTAMMQNRELNPTEKLNWSQNDCSHPWGSIFLSCTREIGICSWDPYLLLNLSYEGDFATVWKNDLIKKVRRWHSGREANIGEPCSKCNRLPGYIMPITSNFCDTFRQNGKFNSH